MELTSDNWSWFGKAYRRYTCKPCWIVRQKKYERNLKTETKAAKRERRNTLARNRRAANPWNAIERQWAKTHGCTIDQYDAMLTRQAGTCAVCHGPPNGRGRLHVDHCHETGLIRGLLCAKCNLMLGHANDDSKLLRAAIAYLLDPPC